VILFASTVALATLAAGLVGAWALGRLRTVRLRLAGLALLGVALPLAAVLLSGAVMFSSGHDLTVLFAAAAASTAALVAALILARSVGKPVARLREAARGLAAGDLGVRAPEDGPAELVELAASFNEMAANLERLFDARRELVAWASHDLRTPLASITAMLEAIEDGLATTEHYLPAIGEQVHSLSRLVDDLFELARIDAGALTLELRDVSLKRVIEACFRGLEAEAEARHVHLEARLGPDIAKVSCAPDKVERVLYNLLTNALRHTPSDGGVAVIVESLADEFQISVEDTGDGLPTHAVRRIFDRFWRGDLARGTSNGGAGLGLAIARGLVEAQGGRIWAEQRAEGGTRVSFTLPRDAHAAVALPKKRAVGTSMTSTTW
jgi:signal transduction histidine kinase